jgi:hypothetical protein
MSGLAIVGLVMRPRGRVFRVTSRIRIGLLSTRLPAAAMPTGPGR